MGTTLGLITILFVMTLALVYFDSKIANNYLNPVWNLIIDMAFVKSWASRCCSSYLDNDLNSSMNETTPPSHSKRRFVASPSRYLQISYLCPSWENLSPVSCSKYSRNIVEFQPPLYRHIHTYLHQYWSLICCTYTVAKYLAYLIYFPTTYI